MATLNEVRAAAQDAVNIATEAQRINTEQVIEGLRTAYDGAVAIEGLGPIAVKSDGEPYTLHSILARAEAVAAAIMATQAAMAVAADAAQRVASRLEDAKDALAPATTEGFPTVEAALQAMGEAIDIVSQLFEPDKILPIIGETTDFRIGEAIGSLTVLIGMLS